MRALTLSLLLAAAAVTLTGAHAATLSAKTPAKVLFSKAEVPTPEPRGRSAPTPMAAWPAARRCPSTDRTGR